MRRGGSVNVRRWRPIRMATLLLILIAVLLPSLSEAAKILISVYNDKGSHMVSAVPLITRLMERGHNVTAFYTFGKPPEKMLPAKVNVIMAVEQMSLPRDRIADMFWNGVITSSELSNVFMGGSREITAFLHKHSEAVRAVLNEPWDVVIVDDLFNVFGFAVATLRHRLHYEHGVRIAGRPNFVVFASAGQSLNSAASVRSIGRNWVSKAALFDKPPADQHSFFHAEYFSHRLHVFFSNLMDLLGQNVLVEKFGLKEMAELGVRDFSWYDFYRRCSYLFTDSLDRMGWPLAEGNEEVNIGANCRVGKPLPDDLAKLVDDPSSKGTIYLAFGTYADWDLAPRHVLDAFRGALLRLSDYRIIFAYNGRMRLVDDPNVTHIHQIGWAPQNDILAHPKTKLFITHGGLKSMKEGICSGKPLVFMPMFAEQAHNAQLALRSRIGTVVNKFTVDEEVLYRTLSDVLNDPQRFEKSAKYRRIFLDRLLSGVDAGVFHIERMLRLNDPQNPLRSSVAPRPLNAGVAFPRKGMDLSWPQFLFGEPLAAFTAAILWLSVGGGERTQRIR